MAFVVTLLLLMFGAFVVMLFQTRMQQQEMAEHLSRLQKEVEQLRRRQRGKGQRQRQRQGPESQARGGLMEIHDGYPEARAAPLL